MELKIKIHDGPGRMGNIREIKTPWLIDENKINIVGNQGSAYDIQREIAEWSVELTNKMAKEFINSEKYEKDNINLAIVQGSKYLDLRIKSINKLEKMGYNGFIIANGDDLILHPQNLVDFIVNLRESINPNSYLIFPFAEGSFIPLLSYMGIDGFLDGIANYYSYLNVLITPTKNYDLNEYNLLKLKQEELLVKNKKHLEFILAEVREHIKNGTLRNLVEERSTTSPQNATALKLLDANHQSYLEKYTQLY
ncbi:MAG: archaeosine tRNA-ribosyltransferase [Methanobrevibacter sp.]|jgi:predicted RNA-binding protein|nr:archaeosine tRNA-ribosyltransferase [Candidatus Methanoflexus mossambicus]